MKKATLLIFLFISLIGFVSGQWFEQTSGIYTGLNSVYFTDANTGYAVGEYGKILKTTNGGDWIEDNKNADNNLEIFPNPANDNIFIELSGYKNTKIEIINIEGQLLQSLTLQTSKTQIDINNLPSGIYFVKMKNEKGIATRKIIKR